MKQRILIISLLTAVFFGLFIFANSVDAQCPGGQNDPRFVCSGGLCAKVYGCGTDDCAACPGDSTDYCGDGNCSAAETAAGICPSDCGGVCPAGPENDPFSLCNGPLCVIAYVCGLSDCSGCGGLSDVCGDGSCTGPEDSSLCPSDCAGIIFKPPWVGVGEVKDIVDAIFDFIFWVALIIVPLIVLVAAFMFVTAAGNAERINTAKRLILYTAIGLGVIILARVLIGVIREIFGL